MNWNKKKHFWIIFSSFVKKKEIQYGCWVMLINSETWKQSNHRMLWKPFTYRWLIFVKHIINTIKSALVQHLLFIIFGNAVTKCFDFIQIIWSMFKRLEKPNTYLQSTQDFVYSYIYHIYHTYIYYISGILHPEHI